MVGTRTLRRTSQIAFLAVTLLGLVGVGTTGILYPYFFCYSCPWDVGACPIGILEHGFVEIQITFMTGLSLLLYLLGFFFIIGLFFGRGFCGWACPIGALQDVTRKFKISDRVRKKLKPVIDPRVKYVKYLILLLIPVTSYITRDLFYTTLCPVGGVTGTLPTMTFYSSEWVFASGFPAKITSIVLFLILILLVTRGWCKYLCPIGAFLAPFNRVSLLRLKRNEDSCKSCNVCDMNCPMDIKQVGMKAEPECVLCGRCTTGCNFDSLKLGFAKFESRKAIAIWLVLLLAGSAIIGAGFITGGYERTDEINAVPCLGCLALDPYKASQWRDAKQQQPGFVLEQLVDKPVFIHYRTDVCPGCDEMEPHIALLEQEYGDRIHFIHINLDHSTPEEDASYDVYDFAGTPDNRFGVPMFTTVIMTMNGTEPQIMYNTQYGSSADQGESKRLELKAALDDALGRHVITNSSIGPIIPSEAVAFSELFVDTACTNCYKSEDALMDLESGGQTNFVTFVTDADGQSGNYSTYREIYYQGAPSPHPWTMIAGGPGELGGAFTVEEAYRNHLAEINNATLANVNLTLGGTMSRNAGTIAATISLGNPDALNRSIFVEAFLVEKSSRWLNLQGHPIPNAFVDLLVNDTYTVPAGDVRDIQVFWNGTDALSASDFRLGNIGMVIVVWQDGIQINSRMIVPAGQDELYMNADRKEAAALPNGSAEFIVTLSNYLDTAVQANLSVDGPANWDMVLNPSALSLPANSSRAFELTVTGNSTWNGQMGSFRIHAADISDPTVQAFTTVDVAVKDDIAPPEFYNPTHEPDIPHANESIRIDVLVGDVSTIESVQLSYFSCTPQACSPYFLVPMNTTDGNTYTASVYPVALDHDSFHYKIIATDAYGNVNETALYNVTLVPVMDAGHHVPSGEINKRPKWMGVVLLLSFAGAAIVLVAVSRNKPGKPRKKEPDNPNSEDP